jgi:hypothetical protein
MFPVRVPAKAVSRQGTRNMLIGNSQFSLDIFVQRLYELCSAKLVAGPHCKTLDVLFSQVGIPSAAIRCIRASIASTPNAGTNC